MAWYDGSMDANGYLVNIVPFWGTFTPGILVGGATRKCIAGKNMQKLSFYVILELYRTPDSSDPICPIKGPTGSLFQFDSAYVDFTNINSTALALVPKAATARSFAFWYNSKMSIQKV